MGFAVVVNREYRLFALWAVGGLLAAVIFASLRK